VHHLILGAIITIAFSAGVSDARAQAPCLLYQRGTVECPGYGAPAATAVPGPSLDGGVAQVTSGSSVTLFGGKVPPNGFIVRVINLGGYPLSGQCFVNDSGAAGPGLGFYLVPDTSVTTAGANLSGTFASPHGYKPIGPVSLYCQAGAVPITFNVAARGW
jgi:hypothetical protein